MGPTGCHVSLPACKAVIVASPAALGNRTVPAFLTAITVVSDDVYVTGKPLLAVAALVISPSFTRTVGLSTALKSARHSNCWVGL